MRSSKAGSDDMAAATGTLSPWPEFSPAMLTGNQSGGQFVVSVDSVSRSSGVESGGTHIGSIPLRVLSCTSMPSATAVASTYGLNEEPTCSRFWVAMFHWQLILAQFFALKLGPPYMARIAPVPGFSSTAPTCA